MLLMHTTFANISSGFDKYECEIVSLLEKRKKYIEEDGISETYIFSSMVLFSIAIIFIHNKIKNKLNKDYL
ncbi:MAG: hypothetical protein ABEK17_02375, partial [Candidatus Aenigmatarchaeota archaeon]